jgi:uncharacterized protein (TIGR00251 family)
MLIKVTVHPESHEDQIVQKALDAYEVYVRASAQNGHANRVVSALLAKYFGKGVRMVSGGTRTHKVFRVG